jgi:hypothetical protein
MVVLMLRLKWPAVFASLAAAFFFPGVSHAESPQRDQPIIWGVCGHPTWADYADWVPGNMERQLTYVRELGCTYYRCSFEGASYPQILDKLVPPIQAAGATLLPIFPLKIVAKDDAKTNYTANYEAGTKWAGHAISKHYPIPYWELGNELENLNLVKVEYDGASPDEYPDKTPGAFVAIASALNGAYHGIQDTYAAARAKGETDITPQMLYGATYRHWGLVAKIGKYDGSLPFDIISWHWYEPNCGRFNAPIHDDKSVSNNRTPAECLADFKSHTHPGQPMDVWITESNRSVHSAKGYENGSFTDAPGGQDWAAEAQEIKVTLDDLKAAPTVKAIFVYELLDEPLADRTSPDRLRSEGNYGLITGLNGKYKDAFYTYQSEIKESR